MNELVKQLFNDIEEVNNNPLFTPYEKNMFVGDLKKSLYNKDKELYKQFEIANKYYKELKEYGG